MKSGKVHTMVFVSAGKDAGGTPVLIIRIIVRTPGGFPPGEVHHFAAKVERKPFSVLVDSTSLTLFTIP